MKRGLLIVVSGPSGTGKGTICKELIKKGDVEISVSATTRSPREGEIDGRNYFFLSKETFLEKIDQDGFLEYAEVYGNFYGTPFDFVMGKLDEGRDVVLEIDIQGALKVKEKYPQGIFIFILPPSMTELKNRIVGRGSETEASINQRYGSALQEISYIDKYDYCVINEEVELAVNKIMTIIEAEHCRVTQEIYKLVEKYKEEIQCSIHQ